MPPQLLKLAALFCVFFLVEAQIVREFNLYPKSHPRNVTEFDLYPKSEPSKNSSSLINDSGDNSKSDNVKSYRIHRHLQKRRSSYSSHDIKGSNNDSKKISSESKSKLKKEIFSKLRRIQRKEMQRQHNEINVKFSSERIKLMKQLNKLKHEQNSLINSKFSKERKITAALIERKIRNLKIKLNQMKNKQEIRLKNIISELNRRILLLKQKINVEHKLHLKEEQKQENSIKNQENNLQDQVKAFEREMLKIQKRDQKQLEKQQISYTRHEINKAKNEALNSQRQTENRALKITQAQKKEIERLKNIEKELLASKKYNENILTTQIKNNIQAKASIALQVQRSLDEVKKGMQKKLEQQAESNLKKTSRRMGENREISKAVQQFQPINLLLPPIAVPHHAGYYHGGYRHGSYRHSYSNNNVTKLEDNLESPVTRYVHVHTKHPNQSTTHHFTRITSTVSVVVPTNTIDQASLGGIRNDSDKLKILIASLRALEQEKKMLQTANNQNVFSTVDIQFSTNPVTISAIEKLPIVSSTLENSTKSVSFKKPIPTNTEIIDIYPKASSAIGKLPIVEHTAKSVSSAKFMPTNTEMVPDFIF